MLRNTISDAADSHGYNDSRCGGASHIRRDMNPCASSVLGSADCSKAITSSNPHSSTNNPASVPACLTSDLSRYSAPRRSGRVQPSATQRISRTSTSVSKMVDARTLTRPGFVRSFAHCGVLAESKPDTLSLQITTPRPCWARARLVSASSSTARPREGSYRAGAIRKPSPSTSVRRSRTLGPSR